MELKNILSYRRQFLDECRDGEGYLTDTGIVDCIVPVLNDNKRVDTTDVTDIFCALESGSVKVNAYTLTESGERLQLFLVAEDSLLPEAADEAVMVSQKARYDREFNRALSFVKKAIKLQLGDVLQDAHPAWMLIHQLADGGFLHQIDVVEIFLITATATVELRGAEPRLRTIEFEDENITVNFAYEGKKASKTLIVRRSLIDLNFIYASYLAGGAGQPLVIDFTSAPFNTRIPCLHAAGEEAFDAYLCALPAELLASLYKQHSNRLLEKNVRSFLQLKGVNKGMQETIRKEPEKFIAFNNGLTITATDSVLEQTEGGVLQICGLTDFQIVNGGQTTATLYFSQKAGLDISSVRVMAKINVARNAAEETLDDLISKISTFSNAQNKVSSVDLRARSPQLVRLKSLSESILTVSGKKWFFERAKGEFATMLRIHAARKAQIEKTLPKDRRFTKEELARYYAAWGDKPYAVKRGGEKIFRIFLEEISGEGKTKKAVAINRLFFEDLVARVILFRALEKMYGAGPNAMGQLRSAVVPYSLSALYHFTTGNKKADPFDMLKVWKAEKIDDDLALFFRELMTLMNGLIKQYAQSEDFGEYSKRQELWEDIAGSPELIAFMTAKEQTAVLNRYTISPEDLKKRAKQSEREESIDFEPLLLMAAVFDRGEAFYKSVDGALGNTFSPAKAKKLQNILAAIRDKKEMDEATLKFEQELLKEITLSHPQLLDNQKKGENLYDQTAQYIIKKYNAAVEVGSDVVIAFNTIRDIAGKKKAPFYSVYGEIGRCLAEGKLPSMQQLKQAAEYVKIISVHLAPL